MATRKLLVREDGQTIQMRDGDTLDPGLVAAIYEQMADMGSTVRSVQSGVIRSTEDGQMRNVEALTWA